MILDVDMDETKPRRGIAQRKSPQRAEQPDYVNLRELLAELEAEERAEAEGSKKEGGDLAQARGDRGLGKIPRAEEREAKSKKAKGGDLAQARGDRGLGKIPRTEEREAEGKAKAGKTERGGLAWVEREHSLGTFPRRESPEVIQARIERAREKAVDNIDAARVTRGEIEQARRERIKEIVAKAHGDFPEKVRGGTVTGPWPRESGIAQARRDRVQEILAEIHGDFPERIGEKELSKVAQALDRASGEIIWYLWENRHAKIEELRRLLGESCHMNVLVRIRETINPTARKILGKPLLVFEQSRTDYVTGENIPYSWWLSKEAERRPAEEGRLVDVFDEGDHVMVIMELAGVQEEDIQLKVEANRLIVEADAMGRPCCDEITLPIEIDAQRFTKSYHNNVLQVRFEKAKA